MDVKHINHLDPIRQMESDAEIPPEEKVRRMAVLKFGSLKVLAEELGVTHNHLSRALNHKTEYGQLKRRATEMVGLDPDETWPAELLSAAA